MMTILACRLHICDYVAVGSLYGITLLLLTLSEMSGLNSVVKVRYHLHVSVGPCMAHWFFCLICEFPFFSSTHC
jgi:hypothetical protein